MRKQRSRLFIGVVVALVFVEFAWLYSARTTVRCDRETSAVQCSLSDPRLLSKRRQSVRNVTGATVRANESPTNETPTYGVGLATPTGLQWAGTFSEREATSIAKRVNAFIASPDIAKINLGSATGRLPVILISVILALVALFVLVGRSEPMPGARRSPLPDPYW
jgi:hypothetical protein